MCEHKSSLAKVKKAAQGHAPGPVCLLTVATENGGSRVKGKEGDMENTGF